MSQSVVVPTRLQAGLNFGHIHISGLTRLHDELSFGHIHIHDPVFLVAQNMSELYLTSSFFRTIAHITS